MRQKLLSNSAPSTKNGFNDEILIVDDRNISLMASIQLENYGIFRTKLINKCSIFSLTNLGRVQGK
jgi:hypothetical protein